MVSIIIVNYNTFHLVIDCINSVYEKTKNVKFEIIVVDNLSPNREIEKLNTIFPDVKLVQNDKNAGFGAANNLGVKHSKGEYLFLLNSDTILINDAISILAENYEKLPKAGVLGGNLYSADLKPIESYENLFPNLLSDINYVFNDIIFKIKYGKYLRFNKTNEIKKIAGYIYGADFFVSKNIFEKIGGFDEDFFMYAEEAELSMRINKKGYYMYIVPAAKIIHLEGGSQNGEIDHKIDWQLKSLKKYYLKTGTPYFFLGRKIIYYRLKLSLFLSYIKNDKEKIEIKNKLLYIINQNI